MSELDPQHTVPQSSPEDPAPPADRDASLPLKALKILLPLLVLAVAGAGARYLVKTRPQAKRKPRAAGAPLVEVQAARFMAPQAPVEVMGTVRPVQELQLYPRVRGEVLSIQDRLEVGAMPRRGQELLRVDPADYRLAAQQASAALAQVEAQLRQEQGRAVVAERELTLMGAEGASVDRGLVLREPQRAAAEASVQSARAALARARLDLSRTTLVAPFNAVVRARHVSVGARVSESTPLVTLAGTDAFYVEVAVPVDQLRWISLPTPEAPDAGSPATVREPMAWGPDASRTGRVARLAAELEEQGRMARLLVRVDDPLALQDGAAGQPRLLLGSYVRVRIDGGSMGRVVALPRALLRDGDTVWVLDKERHLDIRPVTVAHRTRDEVFVSAGLQEGDSVVVTTLPAAVEGMPLRTPDDPPPAPKDDDAPGGRRSTGP